MRAPSAKHAPRWAQLAVLAGAVLLVGGLPNNPAESASRHSGQSDTGAGASYGAPASARLHRLVHYSAGSGGGTARRDWQFVLRNGGFEMTHTDLAEGLGPVSFIGTLHRQTALSGGQDWQLQGRSGAQPITVTIDRSTAPCIPAQSGKALRDHVTVAFNGMLWSGCGGPEA